MNYKQEAIKAHIYPDRFDRKKKKRAMDFLFELLLELKFDSLFDS